MKDKKNLSAKVESTPSGAPLTPAISTATPEKFNNQFDIGSLLAQAGQLDISDIELAVLTRAVKDEDIEIKNDKTGLIYVPWMEYRKRLIEAFRLNWALIPNGDPIIKGNLVLWGFYLIIRGKLMGYSIGQQEYIPSNSQMTYGDAIEGAKSNAAMRLCKEKGINLDLWKPSFTKNWKKKYAEKYTDWDGKVKWRKKENSGIQEPSLGQEIAEGLSKITAQKITPQQVRSLGIKWNIDIAGLQSLAQGLFGEKLITKLTNNQCVEMSQWIMDWGAGKHHQEITYKRGTTKKINEFQFPPKESEGK